MIQRNYLDARSRYARPMSTDPPREPGVAHVRHADPTRQSLLGHMTCSLLRRAVEDPALSRSITRRRRTVRLVVSGMVANVAFGPDEIVVSSDEAAPADASVTSDMVTLVGLVSGAGVVASWLRGRVRIGGRPWALLPLLAVLAKARRDAPGAMTWQ